VGKSAQFLKKNLGGREEPLLREKANFWRRNKNGALLADVVVEESNIKAAGGEVSRGEKKNLRLTAKRGGMAGKLNE